MWRFACSSLVLYGIRIGGFHARKGPIMGRPYAIKNQGWASKIPPNNRTFPCMEATSLVGGMEVWYGASAVWHPTVQSYLGLASLGWLTDLTRPDSEGLTDWPHQRLCHYWIAAYLPYIFFNFAWLIWWRTICILYKSDGPSFSFSSLNLDSEPTTNNQHEISWNHCHGNCHPGNPGRGLPKTTTGWDLFTDPDRSSKGPSNSSRISIERRQKKSLTCGRQLDDNWWQLLLYSIA